MHEMKNIRMSIVYTNPFKSGSYIVVNTSIAFKSTLHATIFTPPSITNTLSEDLEIGQRS